MAAGDHQSCGKSWPGLDAERDGVKYPEDPKTKFDQLAQRLQDELDELAGAGTGSLSKLQGRGDLSGLENQVMSIARWDAGRSFVRTVQEGHEEFTKIYGQVNEKFRIAIELVRAGGGNYTGVNNANLPRGGV
ncbi:hypothetical protein [Nonomuraea cavernae]|uniref:hypothetical protein n=1 Tax=Nonomuraea cavernae TaxID=2045107 RepID=UPI0033F739BF